MTLKLCVNCEHYMGALERPNRLQAAVCTAFPEKVQLDRIHGNHRYPTCSDMRTLNCGEGAIRYKEKPNTDTTLVQWIKGIFSS